MRCRFICLVCLSFIGIFPVSGSIAESQNKLLFLSVSSEDTLIDGVPEGFDIKQFTSRLNKELIKKLDDKGLSIDKENYKYKIKIDIDSVAHKWRHFHFRSQYIVKYSYKLIDADQKDLLILKNDQVNEDQSDLIDEVTEDIVKNVLETVK